MRRALTAAVIAGAIVVVVLIVLIAAGVLVLPSASQPTPVTITEVKLHIIQGNNGGGYPWFGPSYINYTGAEGYPLQVEPGHQWEIIWTFLTSYNASTVVTISSVQPSPAPPFQSPASTTPALPDIVPPTDHGYLQIYMTAPSTPGASYVLSLTVNTETTP